MSGGLTNKYVQDLGNKLFGNKFIGVFPSDVHPKIKKFPSAVIFNLSSHYEKGSHFVALVFLKPKEVLFFDSLGDKLSNKNIKQFLRINKCKKFIDLSVPIQSSTSYFCGIFSLSFIKAILSHDFNFFDLFINLSDDENNEIVLKYLLSE